MITAIIRGTIVLRNEKSSSFILINSLPGRGKSAANYCERLYSLSLRRRMGGTKKLSKFIADWENGRRVACNNGVNLAGNVH